MPKCKIFVCSVQSILMLLCLVPSAMALGPETNLPNSPSCPPAAAGSDPSAAAAPTIEDVWMRQGGARLYYSALYGARQQYTGGSSRIDPACSPLLPPMRAWGAPAPKKRTVRKAAQAAVPCPETDKTVAAGTSAKQAAPAIATTSKGGSSAVKAANSGASSAAQSRAEAIAKAKAASAAEAAAIARAPKAKPASAKAAAAKPAAASPTAATSPAGANPLAVNSAAPVAANPAAAAPVVAPVQAPAQGGNAAPRPAAP